MTPAANEVPSVPVSMSAPMSRFFTAFLFFAAMAASLATTHVVREESEVALLRTRQESPGAPRIPPEAQREDERQRQIHERIRERMRQRKIA